MNTNIVLKILPTLTGGGEMIICATNIIRVANTANTTRANEGAKKVGGVLMGCKPLGCVGKPLG